MITNEILNFYKEVLFSRLNKEFKGIEYKQPIFEITKTTHSKLANFLNDNKLSQFELVIVITALIPHIKPDFFSSIIAEYLPNGGDFPEFGGVKGKNHRGILPTGETVLFILAGNNLEKRSEVAQLFDENHLFARKSILSLEQVTAGEPKMSGRLLLDEEYIDLFTIGKISKPKLSSDFPAQLIKTDLEWTDLVLNDKTLNEIKEVETWLKYNEELLDKWKLRSKIKPGYRTLFYGPSGTGKTMAACLLGKSSNRDVYRIDLSMVVSKYIGETEKNLSKLFNKAANKNWILFFDEADSLFGKRTNVRDAHDKYANQEVSYLLQRIESHAGLVILASNMKTNIDEAFSRRFNAFVEFEKPALQQRIKLWKNYLPQNVELEAKINLKDLARNYELSGANIVNVIHYAGLHTLKKENVQLMLDDILEGIKKEYRKDGKMLRRN